MRKQTQTTFETWNIHKQNGKNLSSSQKPQLLKWNCMAYAKEPCNFVTIYDYCESVCVGKLDANKHKLIWAQTSR